MKRLMFSIFFTAAFSLISILNVYALDPAAMVSAHNKWRAEVGVPNIEWSAALAQTAQAWANDLKSRGCGLEHSPKPPRTSGENCYWAGAEMKATGKDDQGEWIWVNSVQNISEADVVDSWGSEKQWYDYASNSCDSGKDCGHYTQVVWNTSTEVGCGMAVCEDSSQVWVCNYNPPGNYTGQKPY